MIVTKTKVKWQRGDFCMHTQQLPFEVFDEGGHSINHVFYATVYRHYLDPRDKVNTQPAPPHIEIFAPKRLIVKKQSRLHEEKEVEGPEKVIMIQHAVYDDFWWKKFLSPHGGPELFYQHMSQFLYDRNYFFETRDVLASLTEEIMDAFTKAVQDWEKHCA